MKQERLEIKVLISQEEGLWVAEGLDIYFVAQGATEEEVIANFARGICETMRLHVERFGTIKGLGKPAPDELWQEFNEALLNRNVRHQPLQNLCDRPSIDIPYGVLAYVQGQRNRSHHARA